MKKKVLIKSFGSAVFTVMIYMIYRNLFGSENGSVGMLIGMTTYSLLKVDLTLYLRYKVVALSGLAVYLGIMAYLANINPWLGLLINSITFFSVCFIYVADFQNSISYLFLLIYIFMWANPVPTGRLGVRIIALLVGVGIIFAVQSLVNKGSFHKQFKEKLLMSMDYLELEIQDILQGKYVYKDYMQIKIKLYEVFGGMIKRKRVVYSVQEKLYFQIGMGIEGITHTINQMHSLSKPIYRDYLESILELVGQIQSWLRGQSDKNTLIAQLRRVNGKYEKLNHEDERIYSCHKMLEGIVQSLEKHSESTHEKITMCGIWEKMKEAFVLTFDPRILSRESLRISYALRVAVTVATCMWLVDYFNIPYGRWLVTTSYVVIQPYIEDTRNKSKQRLYGTVLGTIAYLMVSLFIPYEIPMMLLIALLFTGYYYVIDYEKKVIFMSMIGLSVVMGSEKLLILSLDRVFFGIMGVVVVAVVGHFVLPYSMKKAFPERLSKYQYLISLFEEGLESVGEGKQTWSEMIQRGIYIMALENQLMQYAMNTTDEALLKQIYECSMKFSSLGFKMVQSQQK